jgi:hypothetical protein
VVHLPSITFQQGSNTTPLPLASTVRIKKLKVVDGGFKVKDTSFRSDVNAAIAAFTWKEHNLTNSQLYAVWDQVHQRAGWDQGYVDSFVNQDKLPPENDPELPNEKGKGVSKQYSLTHSILSSEIGQSDSRMDKAH